MILDILPCSSHIARLHSKQLINPNFVYDFDDSYTGYIIRIGSGKSEYKVEMSKPYPAGGNSGTPVVSGLTGNVIGVMLSANSPDKARIVGFDRLKWKE